jgi:RNA polymerase sigma-70 factor, ECF subfamily
LDSAALRPPGLSPPAPDAGATGGHAVMDAATFAELYDDHVTFVHRGVRRLGVHDASVEDVVQEVFLTAYRRFASFREESSLKTWLFGIVIRVVRLHRRTAFRAGLHGVIDRTAGAETERVADTKNAQPDDAAETKDAWRMLMRVLDQLDEDKREIFVLAELEELPIPEIAELLGLKLNTAYSRLRLARAAFETALTGLRISP